MRLFSEHIGKHGGNAALVMANGVLVLSTEQEQGQVVLLVQIMDLTQFYLHIITAWKSRVQAEYGATKGGFQLMLSLEEGRLSDH